jgi:hypothetical protein
MSEPRWTLGEVLNDGDPTLVAFRQDLPAEARSQFTEQFVVEWALSATLPNGLPTEEALSPALAFQEKVAPVLEAAGDAVLALISTGHGYRELYFYCRNSLALQERLNNCLGGEDLPIQLHAGHDPAWRVYEGFVAPLKGPRTTR